MEVVDPPLDDAPLDVPPPEDAPLDDAPLDGPPEDAPLDVPPEDAPLDEPPDEAFPSSVPDVDPFGAILPPQPPKATNAATSTARQAPEETPHTMLRETIRTPPGAAPPTNETLRRLQKLGSRNPLR